MSVPDRIEKTPCGSLMQHGPHNDRIYLMKPAESPADDLPGDLIDTAGRRGYSKIFAKIPSRLAEGFVREGYVEEAAIPGFYDGREGCTFMAYYLDAGRAVEDRASELDEILALALRKASDCVGPLDGNLFVIRPCDESDVEEMAALYGSVFPTYPFPIGDPGYLRDTMRSHIDYFGVESDVGLIALASSEIDGAARNAEMTDFATLPDRRGHGLGAQLLAHMEAAMRRKSVRTAYTIARAASAGMNVTFARRGYSYAGRLKNNTNISGAIESMNVWYKPLG